MSNYNIDMVQIGGLRDGTRTYKARVGLALFSALIQHGLTGVVSPSLPALPAGFAIQQHTHATTCTATIQPAALNNWAALSSGTNLEHALVVDVEDPAATADNPIPTLEAWALAFGGSVDRSGGL